jgi:hypothetical protein
MHVMVQLQMLVHALYANGLQKHAMPCNLAFLLWSSMPDDHRDRLVSIANNFSKNKLGVATCSAFLERAAGFFFTRKF